MAAGSRVVGTGIDGRLLGSYGLIVYFRRLTSIVEIVRSAVPALRDGAAAQVPRR